MPFDDVGFQKKTGLTAYLHGIGITPVPMTVLTAHKMEQVEQHPASILTTVEFYLVGWLLLTATITAVTSYMGWSIAGIIFSALGGGLLSTLLMFVVIMGTCDIFELEVRGPAKWVEQRALSYNDWRYPTPVRDIARRIRESDRNVMLFYGELMQENVVLDPYLVIEHRDGERACLAIWEDRTIIACAKLEH